MTIDEVLLNFHVNMCTLLTMTAMWFGYWMLRFKRLLPHMPVWPLIALPIGVPLLICGLFLAAGEPRMMTWLPWIILRAAGFAAIIVLAFEACNWLWQRSMAR